MISRLRRVPRYRILCDRIILCAYHAIFCLRKVSSRCSLKAYRHETPFKIRSRLFIQRHANRGGVRWPAQPPKLARQNFRRSNRARQVCKDSPLEGDGFEPSVPPREKPTSSRSNSAGAAATTLGASSRKSGSHETLRWREGDSNPRSPA